MAQHPARVVPAVFFEGCLKAQRRGKKYPGSGWLPAEAALCRFSPGALKEKLQGGRSSRAAGFAFAQNSARMSFGKGHLRMGLKKDVYICTLSLSCGFVAVPPFFASQWEEGYPMGMQ